MCVMSLSPFLLVAFSPFLLNLSVAVMTGDVAVQVAVQVVAVMTGVVAVPVVAVSAWHWRSTEHSVFAFVFFRISKIC